jgi:hypothetical protein
MLLLSLFSQDQEKKKVPRWGWLNLYRTVDLLENEELGVMGEQ